MFDNSEKQTFLQAHICNTNVEKVNFKRVRGVMEITGEYTWLMKRVGVFYTNC